MASFRPRDNLCCTLNALVLRLPLLQVEFGPPDAANEWDNSEDEDAQQPAAVLSTRPTSAAISVPSPKGSSAALPVPLGEAASSEVIWGAIAAEVSQRKLAHSYDERSGSYDGVMQVPSPAANPNGICRSRSGRDMGKGRALFDEVSMEFP